MRNSAASASGDAHELPRMFSAKRNGEMRKSASAVIARSSCDEAIQNLSAERLWIASLRSQ
ncbi:hypothetical protein C7U89_28010 [Bradyrhizobium sp. WBOS4]|nr:hypothetical protein [Bradyrhizobium sp. WBOS8]MDD1586751.1 hypothetical protein [Bradyrhizobium sp. WBOS4]UUO46685.1 hypothetical protein DCM78_06930 [Bradyrhizobium sp. WBOS04]UUO59542.1 hypothetical protein DCM80_10390 [Bradyrhizobium sp. WBOS08]